jgi:diguanylate cyclase (GGDEF)-like protein
MRPAWTLPSRTDHYYWLTSVLAARGLQQRVCRLVAVTMAGLGTIPVVIIGSHVGPRGVSERVLAVAVTASCLFMATRWLRHRWPTRAESAACVVVGTVCIGVTCLIVPHPFTGAMGATSFVVLSAYIAFFHGPRLAVFTWTVAVVILVILAVRLSLTDAAFTIAYVVLIALVNVFVFVACRLAIRLPGTDIDHSEIEPLTGLLNYEAFDQKSAILLGSRNRRDDRYLVVVLVSIDNFPVLVDLGGAHGGQRARITVGQALRETVRHDAVVAHVSDSDFLVADTFTVDDPSPLVDRIRGTMKTTPSRVTASIGVVTTPLQPLTLHPPHEVMSELVAIATKAMTQARRTGGNQVHYEVRPTLNLDDD